MNRRERIPILITSAINVSASRTRLVDTRSRLDLTLESIRRWCGTPGISHVVVCDGSGFDLKQYIHRTIANNKTVPCETIAFTNDLGAVKEKGKGFGEGEIINYALGKSKALMSAPHFAKCTGKLWVDNFPACLDAYNGLAAFDFSGIFTPLFIDTRFYITKREFFLNRLAGLHRNVDENKGIYLEHVFRDGLRALKLHKYAMFPTPRIGGVSGSMGSRYEHKIAKGVMRDMRSLLIKTIRLC